MNIASRVLELPNGMPIRRVYLGTDWQNYLVNRTRQEDLRNHMLHAIGTADNTNGYVPGGPP